MLRFTRTMHCRLSWVVHVLFCPWTIINRHGFLSGLLLGLISRPNQWLMGCLHDPANVQQTSRKCI